MAVRLIGGSLRLLLRPGVAALLGVSVLIVVSFSLVSRAYARDQLEVVGSARVMSCAELEEHDVDADGCASTQELQRQSVASLAAVGERIGPEASALASWRGSVSFVLGHALSVVGLAMVAVLTAMTYATERTHGVASLRERLQRPDVVHLGRLAAVLVVWSAWIGVSCVAIYLTRGLVPPELVAAHRPPADLVDTRSLTTRWIVGVAAVVLLVSLLLSVRRLLAGRPAVVGLAVVAGVTASFAVGAALPEWASPTGWVLGSVRLGDEYTFLDHLPFVASGVGDRAVAVWLLTAGCFLSLWVLRRSCHAGAEAR